MKKKGVVLIGFVIVIITVLLNLNFTSAIYSGSENIGDFNYGVEFKISILETDDFSYLYLNGNNLISSPDCRVIGASPSAPFSGTCPATSFNAPTREIIFSPPVGDNQNIRISILNCIGSQEKIYATILYKYPSDATYTLLNNNFKGATHLTISDYIDTQDLHYRCSDWPAGSTISSLPSKTFTFNVLCAPKTCAADYSGLCGNSLSDGCGGNLDCSNNCNSGYHCSAETCVVDLPPTVINKPYWANLANSNLNISQTGLGDTVLMVVPGSSMNADIEYNVTKRGAFSFNPRNWFPRIVAQVSSLGLLSWNANETGIYYFTAKIGNVVNSSDDLNVLSVVSNSLPISNITFPQNDTKFAVGYSILFTQASYDSDDLLRLKWNFGDNNQFILENYSLALTPIGFNLAHSYNTGGEKIIKLRAEEMTRTQYSEDTRKIYIFKQGINVVPVISQPLDGRNYDTNIINFDASQSYVVNCAAIPLANLAFSTFNGSLNCSYIHNPGNKTTSGYNLTLQWAFNNENLQGDWNNNYTSAVNFTKSFVNSGSYNVVLKVKYKAATEENGTTNVSFFTAGGWSCQSDANSAFWVKSGANSINASNNCSLYASSTGSSCCPTNNNVCDNGVCRGSAMFCKDLTQTQCGNAALQIALNSVPNSSRICSVSVATANNCFNTTSCSCVWVNNACSPAFTSSLRCINSNLTYGQCIFTSEEENNCDNSQNNIIYRVVGNWINFTSTRVSDPNCVNNTEIFQCGSTEELGFFSFFNLVLSFIAIAFLYIIFLKKFKQ